MNALGPVDGASGNAPAAPSAAAATRPQQDDAADGNGDSAATLAQAFSKRATIALLVQQSSRLQLQLRLDRMKADFNEAQEERSEMLRESNALRDMALEQSKKDDEVLKKYIAMI